MCDNDERCDENIVILNGEGHDTLEWITDDTEHISIHRDVEVTCSDDEDGTRCDHQMVFISDDGEVDLEALHEAHGNDEGHKRIIIKKVHVTKD